MSFWRGELIKVIAQLKERQPLNATLSVIAGLTLAADKGIYFTGANAAALFDLTAAGRALLDDANAGAQRTTLGLGTAAVKNTGTSGNNVPLLDGANTWSAAQAHTADISLTSNQPNVTLTLTDATLYERFLFNENGIGTIGSLQVVGSNYVTATRRKNIEFVATNLANNIAFIVNGASQTLTLNKDTSISLGASSFVTLSGSLSRGAPVTKTADFTVAATENNLINNKTGSSCTVTLPSAASFPGREILIKNSQGQTVVSASSNVVPRVTAAAGTAILASGNGNWAKLVSDGTNWVIMAGS